MTNSEPCISWLETLRQTALASFQQTGFPSPREEEWRYTNVSALEKKAFSPLLEAAQTVDTEWLNSYQLADAYSLVLVDGHFSADLSQLAGLPEGAQILSMADALQTYPEQVAVYFGKAVNPNEHGFIAFNNAWFTDGVFVHIPAKCVLDKPIQCLHIVTQDGGLATTRNLLVLADHAAVQWLETFVGEDVGYLSAAVTEAFVGQNAELTGYKVQCESEKAYHFGGMYIQQARDARCTHHNFAFGGLLARSDIHTDLEQAAECELNGLYLGVKRQHIDNHTRINHNQPYGKSLETYKGVLDGRARGVFQGRVVVAEHAQKTDSTMNNRNLLLSDYAEADTKPQLEIYADDVKCGHGVTVGQLDEKSVFYLQSRGVDEETARNMLTFAFANEMVDRVSLPALKTLLLQLLLKHFPQNSYVD
ncbi:MAG: Fe-S cluster assembly protein SufD [Methylovulum sp.]|uniref:Fe-S cluster assembly protein SufD n=1 Tax=Methylovulum sp. TaxID=1916980 RepID=UPI0026092D11|nr:Fe-S cluster assembly protein SufD [Methylovulum sp.]MDD2723705.1 Fe-S cluster assembly protein SufD [Methylovulum sp.]MDD5123321.1 Fe-S cluster assembly protein SufD [Methylovulum sp.]